MALKMILLPADEDLGNNKNTTVLMSTSLTIMSNYDLTWIYIATVCQPGRFASGGRQDMHTENPFHS